MKLLYINIFLRNTSESNPAATIQNFSLRLLIEQIYQQCGKIIFLYQHALGREIFYILLKEKNKETEATIMQKISIHFQLYFINIPSEITFKNSLFTKWLIICDREITSL